MTTRLNGEESLASIPGLISETMGRCSHKDENEGKIFALNRINFQNMNHTIPYKWFFPRVPHFRFIRVVIDQRKKRIRVNFHPLLHKYLDFLK